ncbi:MAG: DUF58 domain-containing protein [Planctomycetes bacterium]|nr:DUF58 domain-containing protein [Planctomycetota bacterium]
MMPVPSARMVGIVAAISVASSGLIVFPEAWPVLLVANLVVVLTALLDLIITPRPSVLRATRVAPDRLSVQKEHTIELRVSNTSGVRLRVRLRDGVPLGFVASDTELAGWVPSRGERQWKYAITANARGRFVWGPISMRYRSLLGLWDRGTKEPASGDSRVYPNMSLLEKYQLLARSDRLAALGIRRVRARGASTEFESLRDYTFGDDTRQMDWKATARRGRLIVRNRETERNQTVLLLLDCGRLMNATEGGISKLDHAVTAALLLAHVALARGDRVGLCTFSGKVHSWLTPRGHLAQNRLISEALYDLRGDFTESDHGRCMKFVAARHPKRSLLVVLTDFVDATTSAEMVAHLDLAARRHVVLFAALKDAFIERAAHSDPQTDREGFRKAAAVDLLRERQEVLERIRHSGGFVIDAEPGNVTPPMINTYLEVMLGGLL